MRPPCPTLPGTGQWSALFPTLTRPPHPRRVSPIQSTIQSGIDKARTCMILWRHYSDVHQIEAQMNDENGGRVGSGVGGMVWAAMLNASQSNLTIRELAQHRYTLARLYDVLYSERSNYPTPHVLYQRMTECLHQLIKELGAIDSEMCFKASTDLEMREDKVDDEDLPF